MEGGNLTWAKVNIKILNLTLILNLALNLILKFKIGGVLVDILLGLNIF